MADRVSIRKFDPFVENVWLRTSDARITLPRNANNLLRRVDDLVSLEERHIANPDQRSPSQAGRAASFGTASADWYINQGVTKCAG